MTEKEETRVVESLELIKTELNNLKTDVEKSNERFSNYQQATQWVVQLAFSLIASATVIVVVSTVFKR